jgi:hypothetical protein
MVAVDMEVCMCSVLGGRGGHSVKVKSQVQSGRVFLKSSQSRLIVQILLNISYQGVQSHCD